MEFTENEHVELKSQVAGDLCKEVIAFANTDGGVLYIGVADDGMIAGVADADRVTLQVNHMIRDSIKPDVTMFVHYKTITAEEKTIVAVTVQRGVNRPYYLGGKGLKPGGVFVRNGSSSDPASETAIRRMIKETDGDSYETMRSVEQQLTFRMARAQFERRKLPFDAAKLQTLGLISKDGVYSNLALLLSEQCTHTIKAAAFSGTDKTIFRDRREFGGSLFQQMEELYAYLDLQNQTKAVFDGLYRNDVRDYPEAALREVLLNALVHRDYSYSAGTMVSVYADRMEVVSVGGLPEGITLEDIMLGLSVCRNTKLAAVFYRLELMEAYGTGLPRIMKAYEDCIRKPEIEVTNNAFRITLPNRNAVLSEKTNVSGRQKTDASRILDYIEKNGSITRSDVDRLLEVSQPTANRILHRMQEEGAIYRTGEGRRTKYLKNNGE